MWFSCHLKRKRGMHLLTKSDYMQMVIAFFKPLWCFSLYSAHPELIQENLVLHGPTVIALVSEAGFSASSRLLEHLLFRWQVWLSYPSAAPATTLSSFSSKEICGYYLWIAYEMRYDSRNFTGKETRTPLHCLLRLHKETMSSSNLCEPFNFLGLPRRTAS